VNAEHFTVGDAGTESVPSADVSAISPADPPPSTPADDGSADQVPGGAPAGVTFTDNGDGTATIAGTPAAGSGDN